ncbi:radical SAM family heme chaperone HemW [Thioclava sp.]|uniref:radical SAM family heme chaperone HemW n=1 Tax=Thioclava sp. TaxID=1933450 RepID=UPI0032423E76
MTEDWRHGGFGLYLHWPFCAAKCPYCDFNSHVATAIDQKRWLSAYLSELDRYAAQTEGRILNTVFFGGGTPSLMDPEIVAATIERIRRNWQTSNDFEITLEANPTSVESGRFRAFSEAGVNRVSMGMQALNDEDLRRLGRMHSVAEGQKAFDIARTQFDRVSFDLIYARQHQTIDDWKAELDEALEMAVDHLSLYQLTIEPGTVFGARHDAGKLRGIPEDDSSAEMYFATQEICEKHGLPAYEISNHARPGAESRHNLIYWRYGDYVGIGPGAHGRLTENGVRHATDTLKQPGAWLAQVEKTGAGENERAALPREEQAIEYLLFALRLSEGLEMERFNTISRSPLDEATMRHLEDIGMVKRENGFLRATDQGRPVLNAIIRDLIP